MAELDLLERAQEAVGNDPLPPALLQDSEDEYWLQDFAAKSQELVERVTRAMARTEELIGGVRAHPENDPALAFRELGPLLSGRIAKREGQLAQLVIVDNHARQVRGDASIKRLRKGLEKVILQLGREHRSLVTLYYTLKADADEADDDTRGGPTLASAAAIDEFFDRHIAAK